MNSKTNIQLIQNFIDHVLANIKETQKEAKAKEFEWEQVYDSCMKQLYMINLGFTQLFQFQELSSNRQLYNVLKSIFGCLMLLIHSIFRLFLESNQARTVSKKVISFFKQPEAHSNVPNRSTKLSVNKLLLSQQWRRTQVENELNYHNTKEKDCIDYDVQEKMISQLAQEDLGEEEVNEQVELILKEIERGNCDIIEHVTEPLVLIKVNEKISTDILLSHNVGYWKLESWLETLDIQLN